LILAVIVAFLIDRLSDRIKTLSDAQRVLGPQVLGAVPELLEAQGKALDRFALDNASSAYAESFRRARVQLNAAGAYPDEGCGVLLCASGVPREGKTVCSVNLGIAEAQTGKRTLIIDGDMRNPRVHKIFDQPIGPGLVEALAGGAPLQSVHDTDVPNLYLLPAGSTDQNAAELLARGDAFARLIQTLSTEFDRIIIDSPPIAAFSDGTLMAPAAHATLLVVSARTSRRSASQLAVTELTRVGREPCGIVFNQRPASDYGYYYGYYGYYGYGRQGPQSPPAEG
jgi:capsular exopolysaccharide synthesis family protein